MSGKTGGARLEAAHRAAAEPVADPGARSSSAVMRGKRWATAKELSALASIVVAAVGVLLGGTQWAVSSALETTLTFAVSPLREDLRLVQADMRSLSEGQAEIRAQLAVQGAEVSALREEMRAVQTDVRSLREGQAELRERLVRVETLLEPDEASSDGDRRAVGPGALEQGGTESHPG
ncbi:MAG: hypothetical protein OXU81_25145 [Gammaproteobacteria bacterium]|nr:hypothetical protein [Gammaproteobacteria bacterium]